MRGYKVIQPKESEYRVGQFYKHDGELIPGTSGISFVLKAIDCFKDFAPDNAVVLVEAVGDVLRDGDMFVTDHLYVVRELSWHEVLSITIGGRGNGKQ